MAQIKDALEAENEELREELEAIAEEHPELFDVDATDDEDEEDEWDE